MKLRAGPGRPKGSVTLRSGVGRPEKNPDNVGITFQHGNDKASTLARLERDHEELAALVRAGDLTAHAAANWQHVNRSERPGRWR